MNVFSDLQVARPSLPANSAAQLAGYVLETGDQATVVQFLERMIQDGKVRFIWLLHIQLFLNCCFIDVRGGGISLCGNY